MDGPAPATAARTDGPRTDGPTVVVTGAAGFIGGRLVERLCLEHGAKVRCIVRDIAQAVRLARFPVEIVRADLLDREAIGKAVAGADWVFHCAYDVRSRRQNIDGMNALIDASLANGVESFVHLSTFSVYEPLPDGPLSEETRDGDRAWSYVQNKLDLEKMVLDAAHKRGLPGVVLQPSIVYGPFCKPWTNAPAEMLLSGTVVLPQEGGLCNAVYIDDLVDAMIAATRSPQAIGERFVISGPTLRPGPPSSDASRRRWAWTACASSPQRSSARR
uniref:NAD-dependent epimerase/dehydratase family protein n=1 Tax=Azospirillum argentinense TaxID=2970906 RepID=UPI001586E47B|nr:NAD-dependent epimerase/dehydratase family protein [Azospirillum argentinense]